MTNFFDHQEKARRKTKWLIFLFALAVFGIAFAIYAVIAFLFGSPRQGQGFYWDPELFLWTFGVTCGFIGLASGFRILSLRAGGGAVAQMLGGRLVSRDTKDPLERRLINVVDEMAIASGIPVPEVYVLDEEPGINAFAAGFSVEQAAVAVTRGALEALNRDELQGVVAHEFSHILNGDMRLNIRLMGVLFGIFAIAVVGRLMLRSSRFASVRRNRAGAAVVLIGLALLIIGYLGVLIGRIIQAAVSRQREYLADASAVQFTRNPLGIGGALLKIARHVAGSHLNTPRADEAAHLFFGEGVRSYFVNIFATHPPLEERIRRIDPNLLKEMAPSEETPQREAFSASSLSAAATGLVGAVPQAKDLIGATGRLDGSKVRVAAAIMRALPEDIRSSLDEPYGAATVTFALLLDQDPEIRSRQVKAVEDAFGPRRASQALKYFSDLEGQKKANFIALVEIAASAMRKWPEEEKAKFLKTVENLIMADERISLFEFCLKWILTRRLTISPAPTRPLYRRVERVAWHAGHLLAALAKAGHPGDPQGANEAFKSGLEMLQVPQKEAILQSYRAGHLGSMAECEKALDALALSSLAVRRKVLEAFGVCALSDSKVTEEEAELLRLVSIALAIPLPPFLEPA